MGTRVEHSCVATTKRSITLGMGRLEAEAVWAVKANTLLDFSTEYTK